jgi:membrane dipeptidase
MSTLAAGMVVDLHSDLLLDVSAREHAGEAGAFRTRHLPALRAAGIRVQVLAVFVETAFVPDGALRRALALVELAHRVAEQPGSGLRIVTGEAELDAALAEGSIAGVLALEGAEPLGRDPALLRTFARLGVRLVGPTWNRANAFAEGAAEDTGAGLSRLGVRLLGELEQAGVALDLAHLAPRAIEQALSGFEGRLCASHANADAVYANARNLPDDVLRAIGERGGVVGANAQRVFLGAGDPAQRIALHAAHVARVAGAAVPALGLDLTAFLPPGFAEHPALGLPPGSDRSLQGEPEAVRERVYAEIGAAAAAAGAAPATVEALLSENALRFLRRVLGGP